jgi:hypothetical protein
LGLYIYIFFETTNIIKRHPRKMQGVNENKIQMVPHIDGTPKPLKNTPEDKPIKTPHHLKTDSKKTTNIVYTGSTTAYRHYSSTKITLNIQPDPNSQAEPQFEEHLTKRSCSYYKPRDLRSIERVQHKAQKPTKT